MKDRIGIGWRPELAAGILSNLNQIDVVEVIADDYFDVPKRKTRALQMLARQVPVILHGVSLGMASTVKVETKRLEQIARLVEQVRPDFWSEHLAFVRGGGIEIGHLAAPPRTRQSIQGTMENIYKAERITGTRPLMENIATLIDPPGSKFDEASWVSEIISGSQTDMLLDLHNLYANAVNFHFDPKAYLDQIPMAQVSAIHLSGGRWIASGNAAALPSERRLLDDHLHDVPDPVYDLLKEAAARTPKSLTVILERDGSYPSFEILVSQLQRARRAVSEGRQARTTRLAAT